MQKYIIVKGAHEHNLKNVSIKIPINRISVVTGLSGSGKSTIAKEIEKKLFLKNYNVFILDGDNLRMGINRGLGFSTEDRKENIRRTAEVAKILSQAGFIVIVSLISPYISERKKARDIRPEIFKEIFIKASIDECKKRDVKGLYSKAVSGEIENFTGISSPYEDPKNPDLILNTDKESIEESVNKLEDFIINEFGITKNSWQNYSIIYFSTRITGVLIKDGLYFELSYNKGDSIWNSNLFKIAL